jgi:hypothetical protein
VSISIQIIFGFLIALSYSATPVALIWGWTRWARQPKQRTVPAILSLIGYMLGTASAVLAVSSVGYAQVHHFPYYDPLLLKCKPIRFALGRIKSEVDWVIFISWMGRSVLDAIPLPPGGPSHCLSAKRRTHDASNLPHGEAFHGRCTCT